MKDDLISRQALMKEFSDFVRASNNSDFAKTPTWNDAVSLVESMPSAEPEKKIFEKMSDAEFEKWLYEHGICHPDINESIACKVVPLLIDNAINELPSAETEWNNHTVACLLAEVFDDTCACNYSGIDEWLPSKCELLDSCPHPVGVACWEQFLKHRADMRSTVTFD